MASENYQSGIKARRRRWGAHCSLGVGNGGGDKEAGSYADIDGSSQQTDRSTPPTAVGTVRRRGHDFEAKVPFELGRPPPIRETQAGRAPDRHPKGLEENVFPNLNLIVTIETRCH